MRVYKRIKRRDGLKGHPSLFCVSAAATAAADGVKTTAATAVVSGGGAAAAVIGCVAAAVEREQHDHDDDDPDPIAITHILSPPATVYAAFAKGCCLDKRLRLCNTVFEI